MLIAAIYKNYYFKFNIPEMSDVANTIFLGTLLGRYHSQIEAIIVQKCKQS